MNTTINYSEYIGVRVERLFPVGFRIIWRIEYVVFYVPRVIVLFVSFIRKVVINL